jgi:tetratricopeptide (TPR) repeat protein
MSVVLAENALLSEIKHGVATDFWMMIWRVLKGKLGCDLRRLVSLGRARMSQACVFVSCAMFFALFLMPGEAHADISVRQGRHGDFGRLVFEFLHPVTFRTIREGDILTIVFTPPQAMASVPVAVPGVETLTGGAGFVALLLAAGARPRVYLLGNRVVVDTMVGKPLPEPVAVKAELKTAAQLRGQPSLIGVPAVFGQTAPAVAQEAAVAPASTSQNIAVKAAITPVASANLAASALIGFQAMPGAAAFRRGDQAVLVFDTAEAPDLSALSSTPGFTNAALVSLQGAQVVTFPLPAGQSLALVPQPGGWQVTVIPVAPLGSISPQTQTSTLEFPMQAANSTVTISDPLTGNNLLVGTVNKPGQAANFLQSGPGFAVLPAWLGVVVVPEADDIGLTQSASGFELVSAAPNGLPLGKVPGAVVDAAVVKAFGQSLNLPNGNTPDLRARMLADLRSAAMLPPLGRLNAQIVLAADMIALGLGPEARGVLDTAILENPAARYNGQIAALRAVANVLSRKGNLDDFKAPGIVPSKELAFWQAAGAVDQGNIAQTAGLVPNLALFETYPKALRDTVGAEVAEALVNTGQLQAAQQLLQSDPDNSTLDLARAELQQSSGNTAAALTDYQKLSRGDDPRVDAIAHDHAVELQLAAGTLSAGQAADALDAALFDWREPGYEKRMRLRIAQLRANAGQWPQAFTMLQSARAMFPDDQASIDATRSDLFLKMLGSSQFSQLPPLQAMSIITQNQDLIPAGGASGKVIDLLAQQLEALNLPGAAAPMLGQLIQNLPPGEARARLGATLAQVDLDAGSPAAALNDMVETQEDGLPPDIATKRALLSSMIQAAGGSAASPITPPAPAASSPATLAAQAQIAEQAGQWPQAEQALNALVSQSVPPTGAIASDQENLLLRLATAASHNNDGATLATLGNQYSARMGSDPAGQMFQTLTAPPLTGDQGLTQALHEIAQLQALPAMVDAVAAPQKTPAAAP